MMTPFIERGYNLDFPVNEFSTNWVSYRMSKRMKEIRDLVDNYPLEIYL